MTFFLTTLCVGLWQAPRMMDKAIDTYGPLLGFARPAAAEAAADPHAPSWKQKEFVIFSPRGDTLSDAERAELMGEARRHAPHLPVEKTEEIVIDPQADIAALEKYRELLEKK